MTTTIPVTFPIEATRAERLVDARQGSHHRPQLSFATARIMSQNSTGAAQPPHQMCGRGPQLRKTVEGYRHALRRWGDLVPEPSNGLRAFDCGAGCYWKGTLQGNVSALAGSNA
jgi:hypothetical protein